MSPVVALAAVPMTPLLLLLSSLPICHATADAACAADDAPRRVSGARGATDTLGRGAWLIDEENDEVLLASASGISRRVKVGAWPEQLLVDSGGRVFVSCRQAGRVDVISDDFRVESIPIGPEPRALALDERLGRLWIGTATGRQVVAFDARTLQPLAERTMRQPVIALAPTAYGLAVASDRDDTLVFVPPSLEGDAAPVALGSGSTDDFGWFGDIRQEVRPQWLLPQGDGLFVVSRAIATGRDVPTSGGGYGGGAGAPHQLIVHELSGFSRGLPAPRARERIVLPDVFGAAIARDRLVMTSRTRAAIGSVVLSQPQLFGGELDALKAESRSRRLADTVASTMGSWSLDSRAASSVAALEDGRLLMIEPNRRRLTLAEHIVRPRAPSMGLRHRGLLKPSPRPELASWVVAALPPASDDAEVRLGRALFHDADNFRLTRRHMSCASCHVDGREDGLVWEQGGTHRQTPMLAGGRLAETAPFNWLGTAETLEANIQQTVKQRLEGDGLTPYELRALSRYVREGLRPVTKPAPANPVLVAEGREVFESAQTGCATCHPSDFAFTDGARHDVRSVADAERETFEQANGPETQLEGFSPRFFKSVGMRPGAGRIPRRFNTPALAHLSVTAPYMHDGSAQTLAELIAKNKDRMGTTSHLSAHERDALVAYLESL